MAEKKKVWNVSIKIIRPQGEGKKPNEYWQNIGRAFEGRDGRISMVINVMPVIPSQWDGGLMLFPDNGDYQRGEGKGRNHSEDDDDLPY